MKTVLPLNHPDPPHLPALLDIGPGKDELSHHRRMAILGRDEERGASVLQKLGWGGGGGGRRGGGEEAGL